MSGITENEAPKIKVFISYSRRDIEFVDRLEPALVARNVEPLVDRHDIEKLEDWWDRIKQLIGQADTVVFVLSPNWLASEICRRESEHAAVLSKRLAPIVIDELEDADVPGELARLNYVFLREGDDFEAGIDDLVTALATDFDWIREHTRLGDLSRRWHERGRPASLVLRGDELDAAERWIATRPADAPLPADLHHHLIDSSRRAANQRQRYWLAGAFGVAILAGGLAFWAEMNRQTAVEQRQRVERVLAKTTAATKDLVVNIADRYAARRGIPRAMIIDILQQARLLVDELDSVGETRPELLRNGGLALAELSDALRAHGDRRAALETATQTVSVFAKLLETEPQAAAWRAGLIIGYDRLGDVHYELGEWAQAQTAYRSGHALLSGIDAGGRRRFEATFQENFGSVRYQEKAFEAALEHFRAALKLRAEILRDEGESPERSADLAVVHEKTGDSLLAQGEHDAAAAAYRKSLELAVKVAASDPANTKWQQDLAVAYHKVGDALVAAARPLDAMTYYMKDLAISQALHASDPNWREWRETLMISHERVGNAAYLSGDTAGALEHFRPALDHAKAIAAQDPVQRDWLLNVSKLYQTVCLLLLEQGETTEALRRAKVAVSIARASLDAGADVADFIGELQNNVAWFALFNQAYDQALVAAQEAVDRFPGVLLYKPNRAHALLFLGRVEEARAVYSAHRNASVSDTATWSDLIKGDFAALRAAGLNHPAMADIETDLAATQ